MAFGEHLPVMCSILTLVVSNKIFYFFHVDNEVTVSRYFIHKWQLPSTLGVCILSSVED